MAGNELARRTGAYEQSSLSERQQYALALARSAELLPKNYWDNPKPNPEGGPMIPAQPNPGKVLYMTETAAMLGIHPMAGLTSIHIIEGKPSLSAGLWASLAREAGHRVRVWAEGEGETLKGICTITRADDPDFEYRVEWTVADMRTAGLENKDNWKKYRRSMLKSRATTECVREACPEVAMGAAYTAEELNPNIAVTEQGDPIDYQQVPEAHYTSGGDGTEPAPRTAPVSHRETPPAPPAPAAEPKPQAPIRDEPAPAAAEGEAAEPQVDWLRKLQNAASKEEAAALWAEAKHAGVLDQELKLTSRHKAKPLRVHIEEIGKAFAAAEAEAAKQAAAAGEEEVVVAEIVDEGAPMGLDDQEQS